MGDSTLFINDKANFKRQLFYAMCFFPFTIIALGIDSVYFSSHYFDGRQLTNALAIVYFSLFFLASGSHLRKLLFVMVPLSYIGELIFCKLLGLYHYRTNPIPLYVPFGHAIVYGSGYVFAHIQFVLKNEKAMRISFAWFFVLLFLSVGIILNDVFSLIFGSMFFLLLKRKRWQNMYYYIAFCVIFIELVGTFFQCWTWNSITFGRIPTVNPPMGAVFFYAGGDILLSKIVSLWDKKKIKPAIIE